MLLKPNISMQDDNDKYYKQILHSNEDFHPDHVWSIQINFTNRFRLLICLFLLSTSPSNALPIPPVNSTPSSFPVAIVQVINRSTPSMYSQSSTYKVYRRLSIPSYSNGSTGHVYGQINSNNQQGLRRERYRRTMIDRMFALFDEDGNGQLSKDELYSLTLRLNIFPKFHRFLKQTSSRK